MLRPILAFAQAARDEPSCRAVSLAMCRPLPARGPGVGEGTSWLLHEGRELQAAPSAAEAHTFTAFLIFHCFIFMKRSGVRHFGGSVTAAFSVVPRRWIPGLHFFLIFLNCVQKKCGTGNVEVRIMGRMPMLRGIGRQASGNWHLAFSEWLIWVIASALPCVPSG